MAKRTNGKLGNTPGTAGGPGGRDRTLAVKVKKSLENQFISVNK